MAMSPSAEVKSARERTYARAFAGFPIRARIVLARLETALAVRDNLKRRSLPAWHRSAVMRGKAGRKPRPGTRKR